MKVFLRNSEVCLRQVKLTSSVKLLRSEVDFVSEVVRFIARTVKLLATLVV